VNVSTSAIVFAMLSGASAATWAVCLKLGSTRINVALGAMVITAVAFVVNSVIMLVLRAHGHPIVLERRGFWALAAAGVAAAGIDVFALLAYERGLRVTSSIVMGGTSTALTLLVGFLAFQEPLTWVRALAIVLIATGIFLLQTQGR
jgi:transporter family protein